MGWNASRRRKPSLGRWVLSCGFALAGPSIALAQDPSEPRASDPAQSFERALVAHDGGLTARAVGRRAQATSPDAIGRSSELAAAEARVAQAAAGFVPRLSLSARFSGLSVVPPDTVGNLVGTLQPGPVSVTCPSVPGMSGQPVSCNLGGRSFPLTFGSVSHQYALQASIVVPLSDYALRLSQNYASATHARTAAHYTEIAAGLKADRDAQVVFYNWVRARGAVVVAEQALATAQQHLKDARAAVDAGTVSRADVLRVESQVAQSELLVQRARDLIELQTDQLRVVLHDTADRDYELGDDLTRDPELTAGSLHDLVTEAVGHRPEIAAVDETIRSVAGTQAAARAAYLPRVDAVANYYDQNPNFRYFPMQDAWHDSWDVGIQLSWTISDAAVTHGQVKELEARAATSDAQLASLRDAVQVEVTQAYYAERDAHEALAANRRVLAAAEEEYRVRRSLFLVGRSTSTELIDAENDLTRSRVDLLNARVDAFVARLAIEHATGRDGHRAP
jgi:outer membrane protein TolC